MIKKNKLSKIKCAICDNEFELYIKPEQLKSSKYKKTCSKECRSKYASKIFSGKNNPAYGKTYRTKETHPEWANSISSGLIRNGVNIGDRNGMKKPENRLKASISAKKKFENKEMRDITSRGVARAWARGDFDGVKVGICEWHDIELSDGRLIKCQGLWEVEYAKYLDRENISFEMHKDSLIYIDDDGVKRTYHPDFKLAANFYVDVKNPYYEKLHARKIELVREQNTGIRIDVLGAIKLRELGLNLSGYSDNRKDSPYKAVVDGK